MIQIQGIPTYQWAKFGFLALPGDCGGVDDVLVLELFVTKLKKEHAKNVCVLVICVCVCFCCENFEFETLDPI